MTTEVALSGGQSQLLSVGSAPPFTGDMKAPHHPTDEHDRLLKIAQKLVDRFKRIVTSADILGEELEGELQSEDFPALYKKFGWVKLQKYAKHQQRLLAIDELIQNLSLQNLIPNERYSTSVNMLAKNLFDIGSVHEKMNRIFLELYREETDFCNVKMKHADLPERYYQFCFLGDSELVDDSIKDKKDKPDVINFLETLSQGVVLSQSHPPFNVTNKNDVRNFIDHLKEKKFTIFSECLLPLSNEDRAEIDAIFVRGKQIHEIAAKELNETKYVETPLLKWLKENEQKR